MERITSRTNPHIRHLTRLARDGAYRQACGEYLCEGVKLLWEAMEAGVPVRSAIFAESVLASLTPDHDGKLDALMQAGCRLVAVPDSLFTAVSALQSHVGMLFVCAMAETVWPACAPGRYLVLDGVQDPGNVGTMLRTADAFALDGVFLLPGCADLYNTKTLRATMGSVFRVRAVKTELSALTDWLHAAGVPLYAAALGEGACPVDRLDLSAAAVAIGSEGAGVSQAILSKCICPVILPMQGGAESLNAAVAAAIVMWEMTRGCR